ncbi:MAG TPA: hypothetical protein PK167_12785 [Prolixibacteraceae bacterium]|mgnify:FL=1|nr:hypothetical protein [Prolixibacteraceae bacterium]
MKTEFKQTMMAMMFTAFLFCGTTYAEGNEVKLLKNASSLENVKEPALQIEKWMLDEQIWNNANNHLNTSLESEEALALEAWMTDESLWVPKKIQVEQAKDAELKLEPWMKDETVWKK